jgi:hypothetical protein
MSYIVQKIRNGDTHEYECSRTTHRIQATRAILSAMGCDFTLSPAGHQDDCPRSRDNLANVAFGWRDRVSCQCDFRNARPTLPAWLTDDMIVDAFNLADTAIVASAAWVRTPKS